MELGDNTKYAVKGDGSTYFQLESGGNIHINVVLYVPSLKKNMISTSTLEDKRYRVTFIDGQVLVWKQGSNINSEKVIGVKEGGFYRLLALSSQALVYENTNLYELWHQKPSHIH